MGKSTATSNSLLGLLLNASAWANVADNAASSPRTNWYIALHTADPTASGNQSSSEVAYTGYARVAVARTTGGFTAPSGGLSSLVADIVFPTASGGSATATYASIGHLSSGAGAILYSGQLSTPISISTGITPRITNASTVGEA